MTRNDPNAESQQAYGARFDVMGGSGSTVITDARTSTSKEMSQRIRSYTITMAFRTACFISLFFVSGYLRWVMIAAAVFLPYVAMIFANQPNRRTKTAAVGQPVEMSDAPQLTTGHNEIISGSLADDEADSPRHRAA